ncbi:MAG: hypothetical protein Q9166_001973 [cf. Caloplaca sp. 2 TL-2023]
MATTPSQSDTELASVEVADRRDSEAGLILQTPNQASFPKWPRILGAVLNIFILIASISIIGVLVHSLSNYSGSRGIRFGGTASSWPKDLNLNPAYLILSLSTVSIAPSLLSIILGFRRSKAPIHSTVEKVLVLISGALFVVWIAGDVLQGLSEKTPKRDLLRWACRRRDSPTNVLVSYTSVCDEQVSQAPSVRYYCVRANMIQLAIKYLAILITIAELGSLASGAITWYLAKRRSMWIDEPWRIKP